MGILDSAGRHRDADARARGSRVLSYRSDLSSCRTRAAPSGALDVPLYATEMLELSGIPRSEFEPVYLNGQRAPDVDTLQEW
jgi:hypothetical protein